MPLLAPNFLNLLKNYVKLGVASAYWSTHYPTSVMSAD